MSGGELPPGSRFRVGVSQSVPGVMGFHWQVEVDQRGQFLFEDLPVGNFEIILFPPFTPDKDFARKRYNPVRQSLTIKAILDHYPIQSSLLRSVLYPQKSIRQIPRVWDKWQFVVMGRQMTLDETEHETLRKQFNEPRIHLALVCASKGCPPLRNEPYRGEHLDAQLQDQAYRFLAGPQKFRIDRTQGRVSLSPIFSWFGEDFIKSYGTQAKFAGKNPAERAVLNFISQYLGDADRDYLAGGKYKVQYLDYDWSLNEQAGG